ncbi:transposase IS111A/IS1328/IS1533, partial [Rhodococcus ruber BKS 20-38]
PPNALTCGIDWARDDHAVSIVDARGRETHRCTVEHSAAGLRELRTVLARTGVCEVAIERPDGPVIDALLGAGITVVVISPNQVRPRRHPAHRPHPTGAVDPRPPGHCRAAPPLPGPQGSRRPPRRARQPAAGAPAQRPPRRGRPVRRSRLPDQPDVPEPLRLSGPGRLAHPQAPGHVAGERRLQRPHRPRGPARPPDRR